LNVESYYLELISAYKSVVGALIQDADAKIKITKAHNWLEEFERLQKSIKSRPETIMFQAARTEYNFAIHAVATGQYRHAYMSLRLHFELSLAGIFFSSEEIRLRRWIKGQEDIIWNRLVDKEQGVFSTNTKGVTC
jgi:hypothetical protein